MSRGRTDERGIILIAVIIIAVLYFALIQLMLLESSEAMRQAERYRARVTAHVLAENGAELAASKMVTALWTARTYKDEQGTIKGDYKMDAASQTFVLTGTGSTAGVVAVTATVRLQGTVSDGTIKVSFSSHSQ